MGFDLEVTIPAITVFLQGILSFLSPCVLPIIPLYMGYLAGGSDGGNKDGKSGLNQKKVIIHTFFFVLGVSFAFFILGLGFSAAGKFFSDNQMLFARIGGILVVLLGFVQLGIFDKPFKGREFKLPIKVDVFKMNWFTALLMGFVFSFAWTPCVGATLSTVLLMVASASSTTTGLVLMGIYTLGFTIPFLLVGIFTTQCLRFFKKHSAVVKYTAKIGGVLMVLMGVMMFTGIMNNITGYLSTFGAVELESEVGTEEEVQAPSEESSDNESTPSEGEVKNANPPSVDFQLEDQFGNVHTLSDYKGKVVFLNFWATWCPPCRAEMPDIQKLYEEYGYNEEDVVILGVVSPAEEEGGSNGGEMEQAGVIDFLDKGGYTYPSVMDVGGNLARTYRVSAYPTTYMIDADGNIKGMVPGQISYDIMESIIEETKQDK